MKSDERKLYEEWHRNIHDPMWFVPRLNIRTKDGQRRSIHPLFPEQVECIKAFQQYNNILVEKPRQIGSTTIWVALFFHRMLTCGSEYDVLAVMHEYSAVSRFTRQVRQHIKMLPRELRPTVLRAGDKEVRIRVGKNESSFCTTMAGGRGQGRGNTFRGGLLSEAGRYPRGSSAQGGNTGIDEEAYGSFDSTMPTPDVDPLVSQVIESTCGPPAGLFYNLVRSSQERDEVAEAIQRVDDAALGTDHEWKFMFFPWFKFPQYRSEWKKGWKLDADEAELMRKFAPQGMTLENLAFRRYKLITKRVSPRVFRTEYPVTWDEPFKLVGTMWFNLTIVADMIRKTKKTDNPLTGLRRYVAFDAQYGHWIGVDASGGTLGDNFVAAVLRDDGKICAVMSSNELTPTEQGEAVARLSSEFGGCVANVEVGNVWGRAVWNTCQGLGVPLWTTDEGDDFVTDKSTKAVIMDWARVMVERGLITGNDLVFLAELEHVREQPGGKIGADVGYHDDHVVAVALALWAGRAAMTARWRKAARSSKVGPTTFDLDAFRLELEKKMTKGPNRWRK